MQETLATNDLLNNNNNDDTNKDFDNSFDNFFYDDNDPRRRPQVVPAKLTADGISVSYSAPPLPTPSPDKSPIIPAKQSSVWYWDYGRSGAFSSASSVPLTWSSTSFRSSLDEIRTPTMSRMTFCNDVYAASPKGKVCIDSKVDFSPQVIRDDASSVSPVYSVLYDDDGNRINVVNVTVTSSPLSPDCDRLSCKRDYYEEAEDDYPSSWEQDEEVYFEDSNVEMWQSLQQQHHSQPQQHYYLYQESQSGRSSVAKIDKKGMTESRSHLKHSANAWSDVGTNFHSSAELFRCRDRFRPAKLSKVFDGRGSKCASDSNIQDAVEMMEPGLRKIRKDSYHTTTPTHSSMECCPNRFEPDYPEISSHFEGCTEQTESYYHEVLQKVAEEGYFYNCNYQYEPVYQNMTEEDENETNSSENQLEPVYRQVSGEEESKSHQCDESGFFSWQAGDKHITKIPINLFPSDAEDLSDCSGVVTVNGRCLNSDAVIHSANQDSLTTDNSLTTIHSLTARSVPRHFREGLKQSMPVAADRNIKVPTTQYDPNDENADARQKPPINLHIIYDSQKQDDVPYPDADYVRTPSPEHVGIPAGPLRIPIRKSSGVDEYTSDESNDVSVAANRNRARHPPQNRRKKSVQQI